MKQSCAWAAFLSLSILMGAAAESVTAQNTMDSEEWIRGLRVLTDSGREMSRKLHPDAWSNPYHLWEGRGPIGGTGGSDFSVKMESQISLGVVPDLAMVGDKVFLLCQYGLVAVDASDRTSPKLLSIFDAQGAEFLDVVDQVALFTTKTGLVMTVDISNALAPRLLGSCRLPKEAAFVKAAPPHAYVYFIDSLIYLFNIENLEDIYLEKVLAAPGPVFDLLPHNGSLFACVDQDVWRLRLNDQLELTPVARGAIHVAVGCTMAADDRYLYAADHLGVVVFGIDSVIMPLACRQFTPGLVSQLWLEDRHLWWADLYSGIQALNVADPRHPYLGAWGDIPGFATCIAIKGDLACVGGQNGLYIVSVVPLQPQPEVQQPVSVDLVAVLRILAACSQGAGEGSLPMPEFDFDCDGSLTRADAMVAARYLYQGAVLPDCR